MHSQAKSLESLTAAALQLRKTPFIMVREALSCHGPHDRVITQEMSCPELPGMQVRPQHPNSGRIE